MNEFKTVMLGNYFNFKGRASRREYWMYILIQFILVAVVSVLAGIIFGAESNVQIAIQVIMSLVFLCPSFCVMIRRLHDTGKKGWWWLVCFVPLVGGIIFIYFLAQKSQEGSNEYGASPLEIRS